MKRGAVWIMVGLALTATVGCRASLEGKRIAKLEADPKSGISYYLTQPVFTIDVKDRADNKDAEPVYDLKTASTPDPEKRFTVRLKGGTITKDVVNLKLQPNGTLTSFGATSESQIPQLITALGSLAASALSFGTTGLGALAAIASQPEKLELLDSVLNDSLCAGEINAQQFSDMRCVARKLLGENTAVPGSSCTGGDNQCTPPIAIPAADAAVQRLEGVALQPLLDITGRLIDKTEPMLWNELGQTTADDRLPRLATRVRPLLQKLEVLRALEDKLASKLGTDPRHAALTPPIPSMFPPGNINRNLERLIDVEIGKLLEARNDEAQARGLEAQAEKELTEKKAAEGQAQADLSQAQDDVSKKKARDILDAATSAKNKAKLKLSAALTRRSTAPESAKAAETFLTSLAAAADVAAPGLVDQRFKDRISELEKDITTSFGDGGLATQELAKKNEPGLFAKYRVIVKLRAIRQGIPSSPTPKQQIAKSLASKKLRAEQLYAKYIGDDRTKMDFEKALAEYQLAVDRFLEVDERLQGSSVRRQQLALVNLPNPTGPTGNESKAYRDYREELDRVLERINTRIGSAIDPKTAEKLPRGTQVTRTLDQVPACVIESRKQLTDSEQELLLLAEMWIKYGGQESIVFRNRSSLPEKPEDRLDCGTSPFGASVSARLGQPSTQASPVAAMRRVRSGMHVRRLTIADIEKPDFRPQGVLVQVPVPYDVVAVLVGPSGDRVLKAANLSLPADDEFLDLGFKGSTFRSQELSVGLHPNGSVAEYKLDSVQKVSDTVQSVAGATKGITDTLVEIQKAQPAASNPVDTENSALRLEILNLMLKENLRAIQEGRALPFPDLFSS